MAFSPIFFLAVLLNLPFFSFSLQSDLPKTLYLKEKSCKDQEIYLSKSPTPLRRQENGQLVNTEPVLDVGAARKAILEAKKSQVLNSAVVIPNRPFNSLVFQDYGLLQVQARIQNRRKHGKTVAFLDLLGDSNGEEQPAYLQALLSSFDLEKSNFSNIPSEDTFNFCYKFAARGSRVLLHGFPGFIPNNGELVFVVKHFTLLRCAPEPWAIEQVLRCAGEFSRNNLQKVFNVTDSELDRLLQVHDKQLKHEITYIARKLWQADPPPEKSRQSLSKEDDDLNCYEISQLKHFRYFTSSKKDLETWEVVNVLSADEISNERLLSKHTPVFVQLMGVVESRRRLGGWLTFLNVDLSGNQGNRNHSLPSSSLRVVLHKDIFNNSNFRVYSDLYRPGSQVSFVGFLDMVLGRNVLFVTKAVLLLSAWQPSAVLSALRATKSGAISQEEAITALNLESLASDKGSAVEKLNNIQKLPETEKWWAAEQISKSLQNKSRCKELLQTDIEDLLLEFDSTPFVDVDSSAIKPVNYKNMLRMGRDGSWWQRKKAPQIEWMLEKLETIVQNHPFYNKRPLDVVDIGGGSGELAMAISARFQGMVKVSIVDVRLKEEKIIKTMKKRRVPLIQTLNADASVINLFQKCDVLVGLHACGVLSDVILQHAVETGSSFVLCTCCFCSNLNLKINGESQANWLQVEPHKIAALRQAAEIQGNRMLSKRAMWAINAIRIKAVQEKFWDLWKYDRKIKVKINEFPAEFSQRNMVLIGTVLQREKEQI